MRRILVLLAASMLLLVAAGCGGEEDNTTAPNTVVGSVPAETGGGDTGGGAEGDAAAGADVYTSAGCGSCHTLAAAGFKIDTDVVSFIRPDGTHAEWFWRREFPAAYRWLFGFSH